MSNDSNEVIVKMSSVYGKAVYYPVCDRAKALAKIAKTKTLTVDVLRLLPTLGFKLVLEYEATSFEVINFAPTI